MSWDLSLLRPGGRLSYVVTNKWMKAGYGEPLRKLFAEKSWVESVVDFGHAKQIFKDADVFPSIIVIRRPQESVSAPKTRVCSIPRDQLRIDDLSVQIAREGVEVERNRLSERGWSLESESANSLLEKIRSRGVPLAEYLGAKPLMGIKTGLNEAFLIDTITRNRITEGDPCLPGSHPSIFTRPGHRAMVSGLGRTLDDRLEIERGSSVALGRRRRPG